MQRAGDSDYSFFLPADVPKLTEEEVAVLIHAPFSPESLSDAVGYDVVYYDAKELVEMWETGMTLNDFLLLFGGCNELMFGSNYLDLATLQGITNGMHDFIEAQQLVITSVLNAVGSSFKMSSLSQIFQQKQLPPQPWQQYFMTNNPPSSIISAIKYPPQTI